MYTYVIETYVWKYKYIYDHKKDDKHEYASDKVERSWKLCKPFEKIRITMKKRRIKKKKKIPCQFENTCIYIYKLELKKRKKKEE